MTAASNSFGDLTVTAGAWMAALDALPPKVRLRLDRAAVPIWPLPFLVAWQDGMPQWRLIAAIDGFEAEVVAREALKTYGPDHPAAREGIR